MITVPRGLLRKTADERQKNARRAELLLSCRALMKAGNFRPSVVEITGRGGEHHITNLFGTVAAVWEQALDDDTVLHISRLMADDENRIARAAVFGRLST